MTWLALLLSAALHLAAILLALHQPKPPPPVPPVVTLTGGQDIDFLPAGDPESSPPSPGNAGAVYARECDGKRYNGIGIVHDMLGTINKVHPSGPARQAGIRVGDRLLGFTSVSDTERSLEIERDGEVIALRVPTADLCYREAQDEGEVVPRRGQ